LWIRLEGSARLDIAKRWNGCKCSVADRFSLDNISDVVVNHQTATANVAWARIGLKPTPTLHCQYNKLITTFKQVFINRSSINSVLGVDENYSN